MAKGPLEACFNAICIMINTAFASYSLEDFMANVRTLLLGRWKPLLVTIELYANSMPMALQPE